MPTSGKHRNVITSSREQTKWQAALLAKQWMRAEKLICSYYPGERRALEETRGSSWGTLITGKWLLESSALARSLWPPDYEISQVARTIYLFNCSIEAFELRTTRDIVATVSGGCMIDEVGLCSLLQCIGRAFGGTTGSTATSANTNAWTFVVDMADRCQARFWKNTTPSPSMSTHGRRIAQYIEEQQRTLLFTDLVRRAISDGLDEEAAKRAVLEGITVSRAAITGEAAGMSFLSSVQMARRTDIGVAGSVLIDHWLGPRLDELLAPWAAILDDGTICLLGPETSWAIRFHQLVRVAGLGQQSTEMFAPVTDSQLEELRKRPKGKNWPTQIRMLDTFDLNGLTSLGKLVAEIPKVVSDVRSELDSASVDEYDDFSDRSVNAAQRGLETIHKLHPRASELFVSRNITTRSILVMYEQSSCASEFANALTSRLVVGVSSIDLKIKSEFGGRHILIRTTGALKSRGVSLVCANGEPLSGLSLHDLADGIGATEERRWLYIGLRTISRRFDDVVGENCLAELLEDAQYRGFAELPMMAVETGGAVLAGSDVIQYDPRYLYRRKRAALTEE